MRSIILMMSLSVDGFFERPGRDSAHPRLRQRRGQHHPALDDGDSSPSGDLHYLESVLESWPWPA